jgi:hypothetical protein
MSWSRTARRLEHSPEIPMKALRLCLAFGLWFAGAVSAQPASPAGATPMRPGLWETTVAIETVGVDSKRTIVSRACYGEADVADIARVLPLQRERGMKCENRDARVLGANARWNAVCTSPEGTLTGTVTLVLATTTYSGQAELERRKRGSKPEKVIETLSGKWVEICK